MNLLIDAGNTSIKFALERQKKISRISEEEALSILHEVDSVVVSKVRDYEVLNNIKDQSEALDKPYIVAAVKTEFGDIKCGYKNIRNLGIDRWIAVLGASSLYPNKTTIVVDAGTAMTLDTVINGETHLGGWIVPGLSLMKESIVQKAPLVFSSTQSVIERFGTDTPSALENGCVLTLAGSIEKALNEVRLHYATENNLVLLTGGDAEKIAQRLSIDHKVEPDLVFIGLSAYSKLLSKVH